MFSHLWQYEFPTCIAKQVYGILMVNTDGVKSVKMHARDLFAADHFRTAQGIPIIHRKITAKTYTSEIKMTQIRDQLHVAREVSVTGIIEV